MFSGSSYRKAIRSARQGMGKHRYLLAAATAVAGMWSPAALAQSIGINFSSGQGGGNAGTLAPTESAGVIPQTNWNNLTGNTGSGSRTLTAADGSSLTLNVSWASPNSWSTTTGTVTDPNQKLMNGYLDSNNGGIAGNDLTNAASQPYVAITGLSGAFLQGYKVVLYFDGGDAAEGRTAQYWMTTFNGGNLANVSGETELTPRVFGRDTSNFLNTNTYTEVPITSNTGSGASAGNYIQFEGLTSSTFILRADEFNVGTPRAPINAIQIIATPPVPTDEFTWNVAGGGNWTTGSNWVGGASPNGTSASVNFTNAITANSTVSLGSDVTVKRMTFDNARSYTINGGSITVNPNGGLGNIQVVSGAHAINSTLNFSTNTAFNVAAGGTLSLGGQLNASGRLLSKVGAGTLVLNSGGGQWGALAVNEGVLRTGAPGILNGGAINGAAAGTIDLNGFSQALRRLEGAVNIANAGAQATLNLRPEIGALNVHSGVISGNIDVLIDNAGGPGGTQGLGGANTYNGVTTVRNATLRTENNRALGSTNAGTVLDQANLNLWNADLGFEPITISPNSNLIFMSDRGIIRGPINYAGAGVDLLIDANSGAAGSSIQLLGTITGNVFIGKEGNQGLVLGGNNTFASGLQVQRGWLGVAGDSVQDANGNILTSPLGRGDLTIFNAGLRTINGSHTIANNLILEGNMVVDPASTNAADIGSVLTITGNVNLTGGARMVSTAASDLNFAGVVSNGGIIKAGNGTLILSNTGNTFNSGIYMRGGKLSISQDANLGPQQTIAFEGGLMQVTGTTVKNLDSREGSVNWGSFNGGFDIADAANTFTVKQNLGNGASGRFQKDGAGTLVLTGTNTYSGGTIVNGGTLRAGTAGALPDNTAMTVNGGLLDLNGFSKTFTSLNGTGGAIGSSSATARTVTVNGGGAFAGAIQNGPGTGTTALVKNGTATLTLSGASTYTGATTVSAGTLQVDGSLGNTAVTVGNNATLSGKGTIAGGVTINSGGTIAPLPTTIGVGALTLNAGSKLNFLLGSPSASSMIQVNGGLTLNGGAISLTQGAGFLGTDYDLIRYSGALAGNFTNLSLATPSVGDTTFTLVNDPGAIRIVVGTSLFTWTGATNGDWDTATPNWKGAGTNFTGGSSVRFDDTGAVQNVNVTAPLTAGRFDVINPTKDYTFSGAALTGGSLVKQGAGKAIFNESLTVGGANVSGGVVQLNGGATLTAANITLGNTTSNPRDAAYPLGGNARGGTLFITNDSVADRLGAAQVTLDGGSIVAAKGATGGNGSTTVQKVAVNTAMGRLVAAPNGGTMTLNVGNLTRAAGSTGTLDFRSAWGTLGGTGDNGAIKVGQINGAAVTTSNGLIGAWATVGDNYASYDPATTNVIPNATNLSTTIVNDPTVNVRNTSSTNITSPAGTTTVNSIISGADVFVNSGSTLVVNSGAAMMSGPNKWWQGGGAMRSGTGQMIFTVLDGGNDHRLQLQLQDNGTPLTFIKNGDGYLNLDRANTHTGPTFVNAGTLAVRNGTALGANNHPVTVRPGATFDIGGQNLVNREIIIGGGGVSTGSGTSITTVGALTNTFADQTNAVTKLTLTGDATIGGGNRWDLRTQGTNGAVLNGGTFTLTKTGGNTIAVVAPTSIAVGNIVVNQGNLSFENGNNIMGSTSHTATVNAGGTLTFWNNQGGNSQNKPMVLNGGTISADNAPQTLTGPMQLNGGGQLRANNLMTVTGVIGGSGGFTKTGGNTLVLASANTYTGPTSVNAGLMRVTGSVAGSAVTVNNTGTFDAPVTQKVKGLTVNGGGLVTLPNPASGKNVLTVGDGTSVTSPFSVPTGTTVGKVELNANGMIVDIASGGETATLTAVRDAIKPAYNNGAWGANGLTSSTITSTNKLALGYALVADVPSAAPGGQLFGVAADPTSVVVRTTIIGDTNLDSSVNFNDLLNLAKNYNQTSKFWQHGDSNYDGTVNFNDLLNLAKHYNQAMPTEPVAGASAEFQADMAAAFAAVPEPGTLGLLGIGAGALLGRRRRRAQSV